MDWKNIIGDNNWSHSYKLYNVTMIKNKAGPTRKTVNQWHIFLHFLSQTHQRAFPILMIANELLRQKLGRPNNSQVWKHNINLTTY